MQPQPPTPFPDSLSGLIERVAFHNEDTGFAVLTVKSKGHRDLVTVVGSLASVSPGEWVSGQGRWELLVVMVIVMLVFGGRKLPEIGSGLGKAIQGFRDATHEPLESLKDAVKIDGKTPPTSTPDDRVSCPA